MKANLRRIGLALFLFAFLGPGTGWADEASNELGLTQEELRYIQEHPVITLGTDETFDPFVHRNNDGSYSGIDVDIANLIAEKTGLRFRFTLGKFADILKRAERREIDGVASTTADPGRARFFNFTIPSARCASVVFVRKNNPKRIHSLKDLDGKRAGAMTGNIRMLQDIRKTGAEVDIVWAPNGYELVKNIAVGKCDFFISGEAAFYLIAKLGLTGFIETAFPTGDITEFCYSLRNDHPELVSIFNKAMQSIPQAKRVEIRNKWLGGAAWEPLNKHGGIKLTDREQAYLSVNHALGVCVRGDRLPYASFSPDGQLKGVTADLMQLAQENLGQGAKLFPVKSSNPLQGLARGACDLVMMAQEPDQPIPGVSFTTPYLSSPYVVVAAMDKMYMDEFSPRTGQSFLVVDNSTVIGELKDAYPEMNIHGVSSVDEGLKAIRRGDAFGLIATSFDVAYNIQNNYLTDLKIVGQTPFSASYSVATKASPLELVQIFQRIVGTWGDKEIRSIVNEWMAVKYEKGLDYSLVWKVLGGGVLLFAAVMYWNRKLNRAKRLAEEALAAEREAIKANLNFIDMISHEYRSPLAVISSNLDLMEEKIADGNRPDVGREVGRMRNSAKRLLVIFERALAGIRAESAEAFPEKAPQDLWSIVQGAVRDIQSVYPGHAVTLKRQAHEPLTVIADPALLNVAILNVLDNACKYSSPDKEVTLSVSIDERRVVLVVHDQGVGIPEEDLGHVFEKFYRSQNVGSTRGVGVGMYLVKKIVDIHSGEIRIASSFAEWTDVTIKLPIIQNGTVQHGGR
ncbi:MAG: transporter substrate-binding domain-containing protein [Desulfovibrionaceae bacterium]